MTVLSCNWLIAKSLIIFAYWVTVEFNFSKFQENTTSKIEKSFLQLVQQEKKTLEEQMVDVRLKLEEAKNIVNWSTRTCKLKQV